MWLQTDKTELLSCFLFPLFLFDFTRKEGRKTFKSPLPNKCPSLISLNFTGIVYYVHICIRYTTLNRHYSTKKNMCTDLIYLLQCVYSKWGHLENIMQPIALQNKKKNLIKLKARPIKRKIQEAINCSVYLYKSIFTV